MGRVRNRPRLDADGLRDRIRSNLERTSLDPVGRLLLKLIEGTKGKDGAWGSEESQAALHHVDQLLGLLPREQGTRFIFDTLMIKEFARAWSKSANPMSDATIPTYGQEWHLNRQQLYPGPGDRQVHVLELLTIRGRNRVDDMDLTEYPWLVHELTHSLFYRNKKAVSEAIRCRFDVPLRDLRVGGVPDRSHAKTIKQRQTEQIAAYWTPTGNHLNWSHELVIDALGIVTAGQAYGRNFLADTEASGARPFELAQSHPPFAVRCQGMTYAAEKLGWNDLAQQLAERRQRWAQESAFGPPSNAYRAAADPDLIQAGVDAAFDLVKELHLPVCRVQQEQIARDKVAAGETPELGTEMLLATWHAADSMSKEQLRTWTADSVQRAIE